jgi:hypothetical protein
LDVNGWVVVAGAWHGSETKDYGKGQLANLGVNVQIIPLAEAA